MLKLFKKLPLFPVTVYMIWRLVILLYQIFLQPHYKITADSQTIYQRVYLAWTHYWDLGHYIGIALKGYHYPQQAFFPLWSLIIKLFSLTGLSVFLLVFILTFLLGLAAFIMFYNLAILLVGKNYAKYALIIFCAFPSTMFLLAGYTEALFLTLTLSSFLLLEKKRYFLSAALSCFSTLTRLAGVGIAISFLLLKHVPSKRKLLLFLLGISGLLIYMSYLYFTFGDPLIFISAQHAWCQISNRCGLTFPLTPLISYAQLLLTGWVKPSLSFVFIDWVSSTIFLLLLIPVFKRFKLTYFSYSLISCLLPLFSGTTIGMVRYVLVAFPVFFIIPSLIKNKLLFFIICVILFLLQLRFIALFTSRMWVA